MCQLFKLLSVFGGGAAAGVSPAVEGGLPPPGKSGDRDELEGESGVPVLAAFFPPGGTPGSMAGKDARRYTRGRKFRISPKGSCRASPPLLLACFRNEAMLALGDFHPEKTNVVVKLPVFREIQGLLVGAVHH